MRDRAVENVEEPDQEDLEDDDLKEDLEDDNLRYDDSQLGTSEDKKRALTSMHEGLGQILNDLSKFHTRVHEMQLRVRAMLEDCESDDDGALTHAKKKPNKRVVVSSSDDDDVE